MTKDIKRHVGVYRDIPGHTYIYTYIIYIYIRFRFLGFRDSGGSLFAGPYDRNSGRFGHMRGERLKVLETPICERA